MTTAVRRRRRSRALVVAALVLVGAPGCFMASPARATIPPAPASLGARAVEFASASGSMIHAWFSPGSVGRGAVLLLHGVGENRSAMLARAEFFHAAGYAVLVPDFQAHGESPGKHITFGALESRDAAAATAFLRREAPGERVGIIGVSMGGAAALLATPAIRADALVLESVYPTITDAVNDRLRAWLGPLSFLSAPVAPVFMKIVGSDIDVDESELRPIDHIGSVTAPVLVLAGTDDRYTTFRESQSLFDRVSAHKVFWGVLGADHEDIYDFAPRDYERVVGGFLSTHLRRTPGADEHAR